MSTPKFTPGPWSAGSNGARVWIDRIDSVGTDLVATLPLHGLLSDGESRFNERMANAHLIAAAPDLYAALESVEESLQVLLQVTEGTIAYDVVMGAFTGVFGQVSAALAKARGEAL